MFVYKLKICNDINDEDRGKKKFPLIIAPADFSIPEPFPILVGKGSSTVQDIVVDNSTIKLWLGSVKTHTWNQHDVVVGPEVLHPVEKIIKKPNLWFEVTIKHGKNLSPTTTPPSQTTVTVTDKQIQSSVE